MSWGSRGIIGEFVVRIFRVEGVLAMMVFVQMSWDSKRCLDTYRVLWVSSFFCFDSFFCGIMGIENQTSPERGDMLYARPCADAWIVFGVCCVLTLLLLRVRAHESTQEDSLIRVFFLSWMWCHVSQTTL